MALTRAAVELLPSMTLQQIASWCAIHGMEARITWRFDGLTLLPVVNAVPAPIENVPQMTPDRALVGMAWWNNMSEPSRARWLAAANTAIPAVAFDHFVRTQAAR